jgi:MoaA/NifB/PqqE/SkfB family radical SAM enzyme
MPKFNINWNVTRACNLRCKHCYYDAASPLPDELSTDEAFALIDDIAATFGDNVRVTLGGGEPLVRSDLFEIIRGESRACIERHRAHRSGCEAHEGRGH